MAVLYVVVFHTIQSKDHPSSDEKEGSDLCRLRRHLLKTKNKIKE